MTEVFDVAVIGGGPSGATAAYELAQKGHSVLLLDKAGRIKPCGGAIPPKLLTDFDVPESLLVARVNGATIVSPKARHVFMRISDPAGFVGMVDRDVFDEWLRNRAAGAGAERRTGTYEHITRETAGYATVHYTSKDGQAHAVNARQVIGADGALSAVCKENIGAHAPFVFAYHEIIKAPTDVANYNGNSCDVYYDGRLSPDFYSWIFPHGDTVSVGTGSAQKGFSLKQSVGQLRDIAGLDKTETIRREGAPLPLYPLKNGTTAVTCCWPAMRPAAWRRPAAKAFITPCWAAAWRPTRWRNAYARVTRAHWAAPASGSCARTEVCSGFWDSCRITGISRIGDASGSWPFAGTRTCRI